MTTNKELNRNELKNLAAKNDTAEAVFSILALRERNRAETDLRRLRNELTDEGFKVIPTEFIDTFRELDRIGVGRLIQKSGHAPRFKWFYAMKEVGKIAVNGRLAPKPAMPKSNPPVSLAPDAPTRIKIVLQSGLTVELPADISEGEARALAEIIIRQAANK